MSSNEEALQTNQYLTFNLRDEGFAIEITKVREVLDVATMTKIPRMPSYLSGVINLRGNVVPVMDLGQKLGMGSIKHTKNTCIIIVELMIDDQKIEMGGLTDSVQMVLDLLPENIEDVPKMGTNINTDFIKGMGHLTEDKFLILLDIDSVLVHEGEAVLRDMAQTNTEDTEESLAEPDTSAEGVEN